MSNDEKVVNIGITEHQRIRNDKGKGYKGYIPCVISGRYLMFNNLVDEDGLVMMNVRTKNGSSDSKICEMVLHFDDLVEFVNTAIDSRKTD